MSRFQASASVGQPFAVVGLSRSGLAWLEPDVAGVSRWRNLIFQPATSASMALAALVKVSEQLPWAASTPVMVVMAPSLAQHWVQTPPAQTASLAELHAITHARADLLFGSPAGVPWHIAADWHAHQPFLCGCVPAPWTQAANAMGLHPRQVVIATPLSLALARFDKQLPANGWSALALVGVLHLMHRVRGSPTTLRSVRLQAPAAPANTAALAEREWHREMLRSEKTATELTWLSVTPHEEHAPSSAALRTIAWALMPAVPSPELLHSAPLADHPAIPEAVLTAWCAQQLLAGRTA